MRITVAATGQKLSAEILPIQSEDFKRIDSSREFLFDWSLERYSEIFKLVLTGEEDQILGLLSVEDYQNKLRLNINLLEVGKRNRGKHKVLEGIAGCMIAYAARLSFLRGYNGMITLESKYQLIQHYANRYGFIDAGHTMYMNGAKSLFLIDKYFNDEQ